MQGAVRVATVWHPSRKPPAHAKPALRLPQQQQARVGGLVAAVKIHCEFLAADRWQVEVKRRIGVHDGCVNRQRLSRHRRHSKLTAGA
jgi:hypothetical protein